MAESGFKILTIYILERSKGDQEELERIYIPISHTSVQAVERLEAEPPELRKISIASIYARYNSLYLVLQPDTKIRMRIAAHARKSWRFPKSCTGFTVIYL